MCLWMEVRAATRHGDTGEGQFLPADTQCSCDLTPEPELGAGVWKLTVPWGAPEA